MSYAGPNERLEKAKAVSFRVLRRSSLSRPPAVRASKRACWAPRRERAGLSLPLGAGCRSESSVFVFERNGRCVHRGCLSFSSLHIDADRAILLQGGKATAAAIPGSGAWSFYPGWVMGHFRGSSGRLLLTKQLSYLLTILRGRREPKRGRCFTLARSRRLELHDQLPGLPRSWHPILSSKLCLNCRHFTSRLPRVFCRPRCH